MTYKEIEKLAHEINKKLSESSNLESNQRFHVILGELTKNLGPAPKDPSKGVEL